jgi:hypothetical protein
MNSRSKHWYWYILRISINGTVEYLKSKEHTAHERPIHVYAVTHRYTVSQEKGKP